MFEVAIFVAVCVFMFGMAFASAPKGAWDGLGTLIWYKACLRSDEDAEAASLDVMRRKGEKRSNDA